MLTYYCRLCYSDSKPDDSLLFSKYIADLIQFCIPEVELKLVNNPILCTECFDKLESMVKFKKKCLEVQEDIKQMLSKSGVCEGIDKSLILLNKSVSSTPSVSNENSQIVECQTETVVAYGNNKDEESSKIHNGASSIDINDEKISFSEGLLNIKQEDNIQSAYHDSVNSINSSTAASKRQATNSTPRKSKMLKESKTVVDVKLSRNNCNTCNLPCENLTKLIHHVYTEHQKESDPYICILCRYKTSKLSFIMNHYFNSHRKCVDLNATCIFCFTNRENFEELLEHMSEKHINCRSGKYFCTSCDFFSKSYFNFKKHYFLSHDLICNYCSKHCADVYSLNKHLRQHLSNWNKSSAVERTVTN